MRLRTLALAGLAFVLAPAVAEADATELSSIEAVHDACEQARETRRPRLWVIDVEGGWRFSDRGEGLRIEARRNLRALDGHVSILINGFEPIVFDAEGEAAARLRRQAEESATLRLGFFLGFDEPRRQPCVLRNAHAVTIVRADLAFAELVDGERRLARMDHDRLRAYNDDQQAAVPGEGPRGAVGSARFSNGADAPQAWQTALEAAATRARISQCHAEGVQRGAAPEGQVVVRLNVETRTGRVRRADVALSSVGDGAEAECIARAVGSSATLPPGPTEWRAEVVDLAVPVRLAN